MTGVTELRAKAGIDRELRLQAYRRGWLDGATQALTPKRNRRMVDLNTEHERAWREGFNDGRNAADLASAKRRAMLTPECES